MRFLCLRSFLPLLAAGFWFAIGGVCAAQEIKFPEKSPVVSFTLPDGWLTDEESGSSPLLRDCIFGATVKFRVRLLTEKYSDADFKQKMPDLIKANLGSFGLDASSLDPGSIKTTNCSVGDKFQAVCSEVKLKSLVLDEPYRLRCFGFTVDGKSMLAICGAEESAEKSTASPNPNFDKILGSFKPAK